MLPPRSPHSLIQEDLWPDEWKCLVACVMLNCTTRKQVEKVLPTFFDLWPNPEITSKANQDEMIEIISRLGFGKRRSDRLIELSKAYLQKDWKHVRELPGIGEYASRMWEIFFCNKLGDDMPKDGALALYWCWLKSKRLMEKPL